MDSGRLRVRREPQVLNDRYRSYRLVVDGGVRAERLRRGEVVELDLPAGRHSVVLKIDRWRSRPVEVDLPAGATVALRAASAEAWRALLTPSRYLLLSVDAQADAGDVRHV